MILNINLNGNLVPLGRVSLWNIRNNAEDEMDSNHSTQDTAARFRSYAAECRRLAQRASEKDRKVLLEIATAWMACAEDAERRAGHSGKT